MRGQQVTCESNFGEWDDQALVSPVLLRFLNIFESFSHSPGILIFIWNPWNTEQYCCFLWTLSYVSILVNTLLAYGQRHWDSPELSQNLRSYWQPCPLLRCLSYITLVMVKQSSSTNRPFVSARWRSLPWLCFSSLSPKVPKFLEFRRPFRWKVSG